MTLLMCFMSYLNRFSEFWKVMVMMAFFFDATWIIIVLEKLK